MRSVSSFVAPVATLLTILSAVWLAAEASARADAALLANADLSQAQMEARQAQSALAALPQPAGQQVAFLPSEINQVLAGFLVRAAKQALARSVALERIGAATTQQGGYAAVAGLAVPVPMTGGRVHAVRLRMAGRYADYRMFKQFLDDMAFLASIQSMKVTGDRFEGEVEVYGVTRA